MEENNSYKEKEPQKENSNGKFQGIKKGMIGTNGIFYDSIKEESRNTTPDAIECYRILAKMREQGINV